MIQASMISHTGVDVYMNMGPLEFAKFWRPIVRIWNQKGGRKAD